VDTTLVIGPGTGDARLVGGRYRIIAPLARGGMSEVVEALDERLHRRVALKLLAPSIAEDAAAATRFEREARAVAGLSHPGIVTIYDHGTDGVPFIVMELIEGPTLKGMIEQRAPFPEAEAAAIVLQVLDALDHAHGRGIVHRDIKPQNLLVTAAGTVKLADFGIARSLAATAALTQTGQIVGTAAYLSPEQAAGRPATEASDLYGVGVVLYELLTGRLPFAGDNALAVARQHIDSPPPAPRTLRPGISPAVQAVVLRALQKRPEDRYPSAAAMAGALREAEGGTDLTLPMAAPARRRELPSRRLALAALAALLLLAAVLAVAWPDSGPQTAAGPGTGAARSGVRVPSVIGLSFPEARDRLAAVGLEAVRRSGPSSDKPRDVVLSSLPAAGQRLTGTDQVVLIVSSGPPPDQKAGKPGEEKGQGKAKGQKKKD
jgi:tRNA A-37 threonylcarbamoyl transferase component Bud32